MTDATIDVLYVGDEPDAAEAVEGHLRSARGDLRTTVAEDVEAGLDAVRSGGFDAVVSADTLGEPGGVEFLEAVREVDGELPFFLLAAEGSEAVASDAISAGVTDYLVLGRRDDQWAWLADRIHASVDGRRTAESREDPAGLETLIDDLPGIVYRCRNEPSWPMDIVVGDCEGLTGYPAAALEDGSVEWGPDVLHPEDRDQVWEPVQDALEAGEPFQLTYRIQTEDGETKWVWERGRRVESAGGAAIQGFITDVTDLRDRERAIGRLHAVAREFMEAESKRDVAGIAVRGAEEVLDLPINSVWLYDESADALRPEAWTDRAEEVVGEIETLERGSGLSWRAFESGEIVVVDDLSEHPERYYDDSPVRSMIIVPLGEFGILAAASTEPDEFDERDVTLTEFLAANAEVALARAERERDLAETKERLELALEGSSLGVYDWNVQTDEISFDDRVGEMLGYSMDDFDGRLEWWRTKAHPEDLPGVQAELEAVFAGEIDFSEIEYRMRASSGEWRWIRSVGKVAEWGEDGEPRRVVGLHQDITDRKERERELQRQNERLNEFASIVSHDLRNPLNVATARARGLADDLDDTRVDQISNALDRMADIIEDVLSLTRSGREVVDPTPTGLAAAVTEAWSTAGSPTAHLEIEGSPGRIYADPGRLRQLLENLFRNAREHAGAEATVRVGRLDSGFFVEDDGPGVPPDDREVVFESGFTTGEGGTGFGLAIVSEIVQAHGWRIAVTDSRDGGARFEVLDVEWDD